MGGKNIGKRASFDTTGLITPPTPKQEEAPVQQTIIKNDQPAKEESPAPSNEPKWADIPKADAVREASKFLGNERSPAKVRDFLLGKGVEVAGPQISQVLTKMHAGEKGAKPPSQEAVRGGVALVLAVQRKAKEAGGLDKLLEAIDQAEQLNLFANTVGGLAALRLVIEELQASE